MGLPTMTIVGFFLCGRFVEAYRLATRRLRRQVKNRARSAGTAN
jgi:hypothetical protein